MGAVRRPVGAVVAALVLLAGMTLAASATAPAAHAADNSGCTSIVQTRDGNTTCYIDGTKGGGGGGDGNGVNIDCNADGTIVYQGKTYQCDLDGWSFSGGCYIQPVVPQPATNDPIWGSSDPATNRAQWEDCNHVPPTLVGAVEIIGPCVGYCAGTNPVQLITNELQIKQPDLGMAPPGGPGAVGFVNQNIWFWSKALDTSTQTRSAANVIGTRKFDSVNWKITLNGQPAPGPMPTCTSDHEYTPDQGAAPSPDPACRYQFTAPGTYTITVSTTWTLVIMQNGVAGQPETITSQPNTTTIVIAEGQSTNG